MNYYKKSADLGDSEGMLNYGIALAKGYDGKINLREAMNYYKKSADLGDSGGMLGYGIALEKGYDGKINLREAMNYYKKSADLGVSMECCILESHLKKDMMAKSIFEKQ
jgi:TPR repeat protein